MTYKIILTIALGVLLFSAANAQTGAEKNALAALKKYDDSWNKKDQKGVDAVLHKDYLYFSSEGGTTTRERTLEFLVSPKYVLTFVERSEISAFGTGNTIVVSSRWKGKGTYDDQTINDDQRCSLVFVKDGKRWKLLSEHCTQIVTK
jgi:ketosteroid isomerase-like protein